MLTDRTLLEILERLTDAERAAIDGMLRGVKWVDSEAQERLKAATLRRIRRELKARARRNRDAGHKHARLSSHDARFFDLLT